jgi:hypothetical protein
MFTLWLLTLSTTHINEFPPDVLYYVKQLPIYYWSGMILACITLILLLHNPQSESKKHELIQSTSFIIILMLYLFGTPSFIYTAPRYLDTYIFTYEIINPVIEAGSACIPYRGYMYLTEFQGSTILFSMLSQSIGVSTSLISKYYSIYCMFIISILIYIIAKKVSDKYCSFAPVTYLSLAWTSGYHFCPQSHALMLSIVFFFLLIILIIDKGNDINKKILIIIVWVAICISHALTPLLNLVSLFFLFFSYIFLKYLSLFTKRNLLERISTKMESLPHLLILFVTVYIIYILYASSFILKRVISTMEATINNIVYGETFVVVDRGITTPMQSYIFCYNIRMAIIIGTMIFGILSIFYLFLESKDRTSSFVISSLFLGYSFLGMYLVISGYNIYGPDRSFILLLVPFSILCTMVLHTESKLTNNNHKTTTSKIFRIFKISLVLFIIIAMFLFPVTRYAGESYEFISESEYAGGKFILHHPSLLPYTTFYTSLTFTNLRYNWWVLKNQKGDEYINSFNSSGINRIYDSGQCKVHRNI